MNEKFWTEDPSILLKNYYIILPTSNMNRIEQLNTCTRFIIYLIILYLIFDIGQSFIICLLIGIILIIIFYYIYKSDPIGIKNDLINEANSSEKIFTEDYQSCKDCQDNNKLNVPMISLYDNVKDKVFKGDSIPNTNFEVESGYIDSDGQYKIGPNHTDINYFDYINEQNNKKNKKVSWEKEQLYNKSNCRKPTVENPFGNIVFSDYIDSQNLAEPCNVDNEDIQNNMQNLYNSSIYRNLSDVWERENSQRMFYTLPIQTVPNDQTDFANWLYKTGPTCRENTQYCSYYENPSMTSSRY